MSIRHGAGERKIIVHGICSMSLPGTLTNMKKVNQTKYVHGASNSNGTEIKSVVLEGHIAGERER